MSSRDGHYQRINALAENGWYSVLTGKELALWHAYEKHADKKGETYPSSTTLAGILGHKNTNHVAKLRKALVAYGLLQVVSAGGGRKNLCVVQMLMPGSVPTDKHSQNGSVSDDTNNTKHSQNGTRNTPKTGLRTYRRTTQ